MAEQAGQVRKKGEMVGGLGVASWNCRQFNQRKSQILAERNIRIALLQEVWGHPNQKEYVLIGARNSNMKIYKISAAVAVAAGTEGVRIIQQTDYYCSITEAGILYASVYVPSRISQEGVEQIVGLITNDLESYRRVVIGGDFNNKRMQFEEIVSKYGLTAHIREPTRFPKMDQGRNSQLDQIFTREVPGTFSVSNLGYQISDHSLIWQEGYEMKSKLSSWMPQQKRRWVEEYSDEFFRAEPRRVKPCHSKGDSSKVSWTKVEMLSRLHKGSGFIAALNRYARNKKDQTVRDVYIVNNILYSGWRAHVKFLEEFATAISWNQLQQEIQYKPGGLLTGHWRDIPDMITRNMLEMQDNAKGWDSITKACFTCSKHLSGSDPRKTCVHCTAARKDFKSKLNKARRTDWIRIAAGRLVIISKPGKPLSEVRPLIMYSHIIRALSREAASVLQEIASEIHKYQQGFIRGRSTRMAVNQIASGFQALLSGEYELRLIDIKGAYDNISTEAIEQAEAKVSDIRIRSILQWLRKHLYIRVPTPQGDKMFRRERGIPQGLPHAPLLFAIAMDIYLPRDLKKSLVCFADDIALYTRKGDTTRYNSLKEALQNMGLEINLQKSKVIQGDELFVYLGIHLKPKQPVSAQIDYLHRQFSGEPKFKLDLKYVNSQQRLQNVLLAWRSLVESKIRYSEYTLRDVSTDLQKIDMELLRVKSLETFISPLFGPYKNKNRHFLETTLEIYTSSEKHPFDTTNMQRIWQKFLLMKPDLDWTHETKPKGGEEERRQNAIDVDETEVILVE